MKNLHLLINWQPTRFVSKTSLELSTDSIQ